MSDQNESNKLQERLPILGGISFDTIFGTSVSDEEPAKKLDYGRAEESFRNCCETDQAKIKLCQETWNEMYKIYEVDPKNLAQDMMPLQEALIDKASQKQSCER